MAWTVRLSKYSRRDGSRGSFKARNRIGPETAKDETIRTFRLNCLAANRLLKKSMFDGLSYKDESY